MPNTNTDRVSQDGELLMLVVATLDSPEGPDAEGCSVTAKLLRSRAGEIVAQTRLTMAGESPGRPELTRAAQRLADRLVDLVGLHLRPLSPRDAGLHSAPAVEREARVRT